MRSSIKFGNGVSFDPINTQRYTETIRGAERLVLEILLDGSRYAYEDVEKIYDDEDALASITISEITSDEEGNENSTEYKYNNFDIPVSLTKMKSGEYTTITLKISQKTVFELQQEQIIQDNEDTQMAVIELAGMIAAMQASQTGSDSDDTTTAEEE